MNQMIVSLLLGGALLAGPVGQDAAKSAKKNGRVAKADTKAAPASKLAAGELSKLLAKVDKREASGDDMKARMDLLLINKAGSKRRRRAIFFQKGKAKRLVQFKAPATEAGITVLVRGNNIHLYLPRFRRIRRIATHVKNQPFMGSDLSFDDMGSLQYSARYKVTSGQREGDKIRLTLVPKGSSAYSKLKMWLRTKDHVLVQIDYIDKKGKPVKRMVRTKFKKIKGFFIPEETTYTDLRSSHRTVVKLSKISINAGISRRYFTLRYLKRELEL